MSATPILRLSEQQACELSRWCINYLVENSLHEKNLFRTFPSVGEIRKVKHQLFEGKAKKNSDFDSNAVAGVLINALKEMKPSLIFEAIEELLKSEIRDGSESSLEKIARGLVKIPSNRYDILRQLLPLINRISSSNANDNNIAQRLMIFAPVICKPLDTSYMSIRHTEILRQIKPILQIAIENYTEIFKIVTVQAALLKEQVKSAPEEVNPRKVSPADVANSMCQSKPEAVEHHNTYKKKNLKLNLPMEVIEHDAAYAPVLISPTTVSPVPVVNTQCWEWGILQNLVKTRIMNYLKNTNEPRWDSLSVGEGFGEVPIRKRTQSENAMMDSVDEFDEDSAVRERKDSMECVATMGEAQVSWRDMVNECKVLRHDIQKFEDDFKLHNKRFPKSHERGNMLTTYVKYRELKKLIRHRAAIDIQRTFRGRQGRIIAKGRLMRQPPSSKYSVGMDLKKGIYIKSDVASSFGSKSKTKNITLGSDSKAYSSSGREEIDNQAANAALVAQLCNRYKELLDQKKHLKKFLKKFDDDFVAKKGRAPKKADKEVMRPHYQKYHELRGELERLKADILKVCGSFPSELEERNSAVDSDYDSDWQKTESSGAKSNVPAVHNLDRSPMTTLTNTSQSIDDNSSPKNLNTIVEGGKTLEEILQEKRNLHAYLKTYEKEFNRTNGRHVMHPDDIKPVAAEYQRYKELKRILKDYRTTA